MVLGFHAGVLDHASCVSLESGHGAPDVSVYLYNLFNGAGFEEGGGYAFLDAEDYAFRGGDLDGKVLERGLLGRVEVRELRLLLLNLV
jgi:hypothetical protein